MVHLRAFPTLAFPFSLSGTLKVLSRRVRFRGLQTLNQVERASEIGHAAISLGVRHISTACVLRATWQTIIMITDPFHPARKCLFSATSRNHEIEYAS